MTASEMLTRQAGDMPVYRIADLNIKIVPESDFFENQLRNFQISDEHFDFEVNVTKADIEAERLVYTQRNNLADNIPVSVCESLAVYRKICRKIL